MDVDMDILRLNVVLLEGFLCSTMEAVVVETAIAAAKSLVCSLLMMESLLSGTDVLSKDPDTFWGFPISDLHAVKKPGPENKDDSETEDDEDEDEEDEAVDDEEDDGGNEDDANGEDGEDDGDPEDEPEANGEGGSEEDENEDEDEDDGEDEEEEEEDEEEDDEEETPQPPAKKRK